MALLDIIEVNGNGQTRRIELHQGDLCELASEDGADILILSAFPNDYIPTPTSLIGALYGKGVSVQALSEHKAVDLRQAFSCWLSEPLEVSGQGFQFKRILCFEPLASWLIQAGKSVYMDVLSLDKGVAWQAGIFAALDDCAKVIALYSPSYLVSKICLEEFNIAWTRARKAASPIIFPIYWQSAELPTYMEMLNFADCREARKEGLLFACSALLLQL